MKGMLDADIMFVTPLLNSSRDHHNSCTISDLPIFDVRTSNKLRNLPITSYLLDVMYRRSLYSIGERASCVLMVLSLLWLTVSLPFVNNFRLSLSTVLDTRAMDDRPFNACEENSTNNTSEEKNTNVNSASEEYLHSHHSSLHPPQLQMSAKYHTKVNLHDNFVSDLLSPPPERQVF
jgi:hypothetical protein